MPERSRRPVLWLLLLPYIGLLWVPFYNAREPEILGFPFFYWYQFVWVPITALITGSPIGACAMTTEHRRHALAVFVFFFILVTVMGFIAARWQAGETLAHIDEWGLGGRKFGTWITWFLVGGDFYTAYTVIAVPALVYAVGAYGFFALPYTIIVYPFVFMVMPKLWKRAKEYRLRHRRRRGVRPVRLARAGTCRGGHRRPRHHALYRAAARRHGGGDQGAGADTANCRWRSPSSSWRSTPIPRACARRR